MASTARSARTCVTASITSTLCSTAGLAAAADRALLVRAIGDAALRAPIAVRAMVDPSAPEMSFDSTVSRELLYVFHHTVHHTALMSAQATNMGIQPDPRAGRAPATIAHDGKR